MKMSLLAQNIFYIFMLMRLSLLQKTIMLNFCQMLWKNLEKLLSFLMTDLHQMLSKCHELK